MHPKRFRERIGDKYITAQNGQRFTSPSANTQLSYRSGSVGNLHKAILEVAMKLQANSKSTVLQKFQQQMETRDHYILLQAPKLQQQKGLRQKQIKIWLGDLCKHVFSVSFNYFSHKIFDTQTMQVFSSQCMIGNIIQLSKINNLTEQDFQLINLHLKNQILPYFLLRYPQSNNKQVNQKLNKQVSATDYLDTNMNNMFLKSKIKFQYRQNGIYFDLIMKFLNYIQQLPMKKVQNQSVHTLFDDFNEKMQKLFTSVFNRKWTQANFYDQYNNSQQTVQNLRQKVLALQNQIQQKSNKSIIDVKNLTSHEQTTQLQKDYADIVKQYTKYAINRKVSQNVPTYTSQQIKHGNIKILDPSILRIIVKWCTQLQQKFKIDYFIQRSQPFVMDNGDEVQMTQQLRSKLCEYASIEWKQIQKFLKQIQSNIYQRQADLSYKNLMYYSTQKLPQYEQSIIKFANRNTDDVNHYAVCYLNRLIHGIMTISKQIFDRHLNGWAQWPYPPILLSFMISDLMRCKCFSKQKQIIRIYKQLQIQSQINPQIIRIVKVKNRLNRGTKDILLNVLFHKTTLCQIQLAIKVDQSQFSLWSDKFNHYIYQLQRSTYGPITQMCSIWSSLDQRSSLLKYQKIRIPQYNNICQIHQYNIQILPFTCSICYKHYSQSRYIYDHFKCNKCQKYWICAICRINTLNQQQLINQLQSRNHTLEIVKRINQNNNKQLPEYIIGFKLQSLQAIGQKFRKFQIDNLLMLAKLQSNKLKVITIKKNDKKQYNKLFQNYIFFAQEKPDEELLKITSQQALDQTSLTQISQCYKKKLQSMRIPGKKITKQLLLKINDPRAQANINTLSLPQNLIDSVKQIGTKFMNVKILNLNKNNITSLQGLGRMNLITDLYMGQNKFKEIIELDKLTHVKYVQLGDNPNAPQFKCDLSKLIHLQTLTLIRSNLNQFPIQVTNVQNLKLLWLFQNNIKRIPSSIAKLKNLQFLHLQMNQLQELPEQLFTLIKLKKLILSYNKLQKISSSISKLKNLQLLSLQSNPFKQIPVDQIIKLLAIQVLSINSEYQPLFMGRQITGLLFK